MRARPSSTRVSTKRQGSASSFLDQRGAAAAGNDALRVRAEHAEHSLDGAGLCVAATGLDRIHGIARRAHVVPFRERQPPVCSCSTKRIRSMPGRIRPPSKTPNADSRSMVVAVPAVNHQARSGMQGARRNQRGPAIGPELLGPLVAVRHPAALGFAAQPVRLRFENAGPVDQQLVAPFAGHVGDDDPLRILVRRGERI